VSALYCVITVFCFENVLEVYWNEKTNVASHRLWALLAATILAPAMVIGFFAFGTLILLCKTVGEGGLTYSYGALHFSSLWMAVLVLQSAVTMHAYKAQMKVWAKNSTGTLFVAASIRFVSSCGVTAFHSADMVD
jgi:hypothetical protein